MPAASSSEAPSRGGDAGGLGGAAPAAGRGDRAGGDVPGGRWAFLRDVPERIPTRWPLKVAAAAVLLPAFDVPYFLIQRMPLRAATMFEPSRLDQAVAFEPAWTWVYVSFYPFIPLTAMLAVEPRDLLRYVVGMLAMALAASLAFVFYPVAGPRPPLPADPGLYGLLVSIDRPVNSFPSLHVGLTVFPLLFGWGVLRPEFGRGAGTLMLLLTAWGVLICYSTLPTKQHYAVDVAAGAALAWACYTLTAPLGRTRGVTP